MKVINLFGHDFDYACNLLAQKVSELYNADLVIAVLTGGGYIGRVMMKNSCMKAIYTEVKLQRGSTKAKEVSHLKAVLQFLPECVELLELKAKFVKPNRYGTLSFPEDIASILQEGNRKILLVDDCIDTGYTLKLIKEFIEKHYPGNEIKIAVVTTAHRHPVIKADFQLYKRVLIRFPWAYDAK